MEKIFNVLSVHQKKILGLSNVVGVGVGYKEVAARGTEQLSLTVLVKEKKDRSVIPESHLIPKAINSVITDVIEVGDVRLLSDRVSLQRPAHPGISIGHRDITAGTFGAVVKDATTGKPMILSNNHVLANASDGKDGRAKPGDPVMQPGPYDGGTKDNIIGYLDRFVPLVKESSPASCNKARTFVNFLNFLLRFLKIDYNLEAYRVNPRPNMVDAALARPVSPDLISPEIIELGKVNGTARAELNTEVQKSGRTSGVNHSVVKVVNATLRVMVTPKDAGLFAHQFITGPMAKPGDSGSLVLDKENRAVGLLFAGSDKIGVFNDIYSVMELLKVGF